MSSNHAGSQKFFVRKMLLFYPLEKIIPQFLLLVVPLLPCFFFTLPLFSFQGADEGQIAHNRYQIIDICSDFFPLLSSFKSSLRRLQAPTPQSTLNWWAQVDSNHRPHDYQSCALNQLSYGPSSSQTPLRWASRRVKGIPLVEISGFEPLTSCVQGRRSPS